MEKIKQHLALVFNGKVWLSASQRIDWFTFNTTTGHVVDIGPNPHPDKDNFKQVIDAEGSRIFPGFHDSHIHVSMLGESMMSADLTGCSSIKNMQDRIKLNAEANPNTTWVAGTGWDQVVLGRYPNKEDIDAVCSDRPAKLSRVCYHVAVVNSKALELCGITRYTPDPEGGVIERYPPGHPQEGEPTGIMRELSALDLIDKCRIRSKVRVAVKELLALDLIQKSKIPSKEEKKSHIKAGLNHCLKTGLTAVDSNEEIHWNEYCELAKNDQLPIRVFMACFYADRNSGNFPRPPGEKCGDMLSCDRVKLFVDGSVGAGTAALSKPYKNQPGNYGMFQHTQQTLNHLVNEANSAGFRLEMHVIGDRAAESALTALEEAEVSPERRPILTHCQFLREELVNTMVQQNAIANIQPQFVPADAPLLPSLIDPELLGWSYAWKSLLQKGQVLRCVKVSGTSFMMNSAQDRITSYGVVCAGGSDSPVVLPGPLIGIYDAIYRPSGEKYRENQDSFRPEECLSVEEAVDCYTKAGAYTAMREHDLGQLLPGYWADFVIIKGSIDPIEHPQHFRTVSVKQDAANRKDFSVYRMNDLKW